MLLNIQPGGIQGAFTDTANQPLECRMMGTDAAAHAARESEKKPARATACWLRPGTCCGAGAPELSSGS